jgi:hypothetical protein
MSDPHLVIELASLAASIVTGLAALYIAYVALQHTARPNIDIRLIAPQRIRRGEEVTIIFEVTNIGHWYAKPSAINVTIFFNFDPAFDLIESRYGSTQEFKDSEPQIGKGGMKYLKAKGLKLGYGHGGEQVHIIARAPAQRGDYRVRLSAYSENGASFGRDLSIGCV